MRKSSTIVSALSWVVNNGFSHIPPAVIVRPPLSWRQLLIVRSDLAGYIQSFVPSRPSVSLFRPLSLTTTGIVCLAGHALTSVTYSSERTMRAREHIDTAQRCHRICRIAETFAAWAAWKIILRCRKREPGRTSNGSRSSREIGNFVTSPLSRPSGMVSLLTRKFFRA